MKFNKKDAPIDDRLLLPAYGNTIAWLTILLGLLIVVQAGFSWGVLGKELSSFVFKCAILIGLGFFVISKNMFNLRAGLLGRLSAMMASVVYAIVIVIISPVISYLKGDGLSTSLEPAEVMINICIFYFITLFIRIESSSKEKSAKRSQVEN